MNVIEILEKYLKENKLDGLCNPEEECGCRIGDLAPCGTPGRDCVGGVAAMGEDGEIIHSILTEDDGK